MPAWVTVERLERVTGPQPDAAVAVGVLEHVSALAAPHVRGSAAWTAATAPPLAQAIVVEAAIRLLANPERLRVEQGPGYGVTYGDTSDVFTGAELVALQTLSTTPPGAGVGGWGSVPLAAS